MQIFFYIISFYFILIVLCALSCKRHNNPIFTHSEKDSARLITYLDSVYDLQFDYPDSAYRLWQTAATEAKERKIYRPLQVYYKYAIGNRLLLVSDTATAQRMAAEAMQLANKTRDSLHLGLAHFNYGMVYGYKEITDSASWCFMRAAEYLQNGKDAGTLLDAYHNLAEMMRLQGDNVNAEKYLLHTLAITKKRNEILPLAVEYEALYQVEDALGRTEKAKAYLDSAEIYYTKGKLPAEPSLLKMKGDYAFNHGSEDTALYYYNTSFQAYLQNGDSLNAGIALLNKARIFSKKAKSDSVAAYLQEMQKWIQPQMLPLTSLKEYYKANLSLPPKMLSDERHIKLSNDYNQLLSSMLDQNQKLIGTEYQHQTEQAQKDAILLKKTLESTRRQKTIWILSGSLVIAAILSLFSYLYWRKRRELEKKKLNLLHQEKALELLQTRMTTQLEERSRIAQELHDDLGATLTSISLATQLLKKKYGLEESKEVTIIGDASADMVDKMNEIVWSLNTSNDNVQSLTAYIRKFAAAFLEEAGIGLEIAAPEGLPEKPLAGYIRRNLYLTVKEALHNIVKHAQATKVLLQFRLTEDQIYIDITDNGVGMDSKKESGLGNGLRNMKSNLTSIGGVINWSGSGGTIINIICPVG